MNIGYEGHEGIIIKPLFPEDENNSTYVAIIEETDEYRYIFEVVIPDKNSEEHDNAAYVIFVLQNHKKEFVYKDVLTVHKHPILETIALEDLLKDIVLAQDKVPMYIFTEENYDNELAAVYAEEQRLQAFKETVEELLLKNDQ